MPAHEVAESMQLERVAGGGERLWACLPTSSVTGTVRGLADTCVFACVGLCVAHANAFVVKVNGHVCALS